MDNNDISKTPSLISDIIDEDDVGTNTLILTPLSKSFFDPSVLDALKEHFSSYGDLHSWAPLKSWQRIIMVYWNSEDAEHARSECDMMQLADEGGGM